KRLGQLRDLTCHHNSLSEDMAAVIAVLPLEQVFLHGKLDDTMVHALAAHATLQHMRLTLRSPVSLTPLLDAPRLRRLSLRYDQFAAPEAVPTDEQLRAFRDRGITIEVEDLRRQ